MVATKVSALTADTAPTSDDLVLIVDAPGGSPVSKKVTLANIEKAVVLTGAGAPATTPDYVGQRYVDTTAKVLYSATDTSSSADWDQDTGTEVTGTSAMVLVYDGSNNLQSVALSGDGTITNAGVLDIASVSDVIIQDYQIQNASPASASNITTLNYPDGPDFDITLTENTTIAFTNWPATGDLGKISLQITQDAVTPRTVAMTNIDAWPGGTAMIMSTGVGEIDEVVFWTRDAGTTVYGAIVGQAFA